jgi:cellulose synthase/poly-beta-1,6-N-acetylglucosamine synthase-like glycosyltransferase
LTILIPAHNEEKVIGDCLNSLMSMDIPEEITEVEYVVIDDRSEDNTYEIAKSRGATVLQKRFRGKYVSAIAEAMAYGFQHTKGELIIKCDSDIIAPRNALNIIKCLDKSVGRISCEVKTKTGKKWLDFLMWLRDINYRLIPLGEIPRGAFTVFRREVVEEIGGFDNSKPTWDTAFDIHLKKHGYRIEKNKKIIAIELRKNLTLRRIINHQISAGKSRKKLGISFYRTLMHSIFRFRFYVMYGYLKG